MPQQVEVYVPVSYNDGSCIPSAVLAKQLEALIQVFGGATVIPCDGGWLNPNAHTIVAEPIEIWRILVCEYDADWWAQWVDYMCALLKQDVLLATHVPIEYV